VGNNRHIWAVCFNLLSAPAMHTVSDALFVTCFGDSGFWSITLNNMMDSRAMLKQFIGLLRYFVIVDWNWQSATFARQIVKNSSLKYTGQIQPINLPFAHFPLYFLHSLPFHSPSTVPLPLLLHPPFSLFLSIPFSLIFLVFPFFLLYHYL